LAKPLPQRHLEATCSMWRALLRSRFDELTVVQRHIVMILRHGNYYQCAFVRLADREG